MTGWSDQYAPDPEAPGVNSLPEAHEDDAKWDGYMVDAMRAIEADHQHFAARAAERDAEYRAALKRTAELANDEAEAGRAA